MKVGIVGLANSGKTTVFNALTGLNMPTTVYPSTESEPHRGVVKVPDGRVVKLTEIFQPKKTVFATVEYTDYLGISRGDAAQNRKVIDMIKDVDAVVQVVRVFEDDQVVHPLDKVNPSEDASAVHVEMIFADLELVEKRLERMEEGRKKGRGFDENERKVLFRCREALESEKPLRRVDFTEEELSSLRHLQFITLKPRIVLLNMAEEDLGSDRETDLLEKIGADGDTVTSLSAKIEMEIAQLEGEEAEEFLKDLGMKEPASEKLIDVCYRHLGLLSFLTVGKDEVRAWTIDRGTSAVKAAGKIHSDIERGFIRAEVVSYDDFMSSGSIPAAREKGLVRLEGKTYEILDGDIINFRFNV